MPLVLVSFVTRSIYPGGDGGGGSGAVSVSNEEQREAGEIEWFFLGDW